MKAYIEVDGTVKLWPEDETDSFALQVLGMRLLGKKGKLVFHPEYGSERYEFDITCGTQNES